MIVPAPRPGLALAIVVILGSVWGAAFSLIKIAVEGGISPFAFICMQGLGAGSVLLVISMIRRGVPALSARHLRYYTIVGIGNTAIPSSIVAIALGHIPMGVHAVIMTLLPMVTYAFACTVRVEAFMLRRFIGLIFGLGGALLILLPRASLPSPDMLPWVLLDLLAPAIYAAGNIFMAVARPPGTDSLVLGGFQQFMAGFFLLPIVLVAGLLPAAAVPVEAPGLAVLGYIVMMSFAALLSFEVIRHGGPIMLALMTYVMTPSGVIAGYFIFDERPSVWLLAALVSIMIGLVLVTWPTRPSPPVA